MTIRSLIANGETLAVEFKSDARELEVVRKPRRPELLERLRNFRGRLPADFRFDRNEAKGR
jgi:antitoxin MazE